MGPELLIVEGTLETCSFTPFLLLTKSLYPEKLCGSWLDTQLSLELRAFCILFQVLSAKKYFSLSVPFIENTPFFKSLSAAWQELFTSICRGTRR